MRARCTLGWESIICHGFDWFIKNSEKQRSFVRSRINECLFVHHLGSVGLFHLFISFMKKQKTFVHSNALKSLGVHHRTKQVIHCHENLGKCSIQKEDE